MISITEIQEAGKKRSMLPRFGLWHKKMLLAFVDLSILIFYLFYYYSSGEHDPIFYDFININTLNLLFGITVFWALTIIFNFYDLNFVNKTRKVLPLSFFIGLLLAICYIFFSFLNQETKATHTLVVFTLGFTVSLMFWRVFYASVIHSNIFVKNCILLTSQNQDSNFTDQIKTSIEGNGFEYGLKILRFYSVTEDQKQINTLSRAIERMSFKKLIDTIIILDIDQGIISSSLNTSLVKAIGNKVEVKTYFNLYEDVKEALPIQYAGNQFYNILPISKYHHNYFYLLWHKIIDILSAILGLSFMILLTPLIILLNMLFNKGPLFYKQLRVGKGGKEILITKFRTMIVEAEKHGAKMSEKGDLRVTSFGRVLRKTRIDELPQFWSVLMGEMSLIGPRPERKIFIDQLIKSIPLYDSRHLIKPGITGWAQVKYEYGDSIADSCKKLEYDLYYIKNRSVTLDIRIIFKTINTIVFYKGR